MPEFKEISCIQDLERILNESSLSKILIFKHSTTCPISAQAWQEVKDFIQESSKKILVVMIKVIESRPISNLVAETFGVKHQSPQVLLLSNRKVLWHTSHQNVTHTNIKRALEGETFSLN